MEKKICPNTKCPRYSKAAEETLHAIQDCSASRAVWVLLLSQADHTIFFSLNLKDWLSLKLRKGGGWARSSMDREYGFDMLVVVEMAQC